MTCILVTPLAAPFIMKQVPHCENGKFDCVTREIQTSHDKTATQISQADAELKIGTISRLVGLIVIEIWAFKDRQLVLKREPKYGLFL
jgi:hypothetical protein